MAEKIHEIRRGSFPKVKEITASWHDDGMIQEEENYTGEGGKYVKATSLRR